MLPDAKIHSRQKPFIRVLSWMLLLVLLPVMVLCIAIVIQSARLPERLPSVMGYKALILLPDDSGAGRPLGVIRALAPEQLSEGDLVAYRENGVYYIEPVDQLELDRNRVTLLAGSVTGERVIRTAVAVDQIEGVLVRRIPQIGGWALYLQTPAGMLLFLMLPCLIFFLLDALRRNRPAVPAPFEHPVQPETASISDGRAARVPAGALSGGLERGSIRISET